MKEEPFLFETAKPSESNLRQGELSTKITELQSSNPMLGSDDLTEAIKRFAQQST